jgi:integrase/recombinase XerD
MTTTNKSEYRVPNDLAREYLAANDGLVLERSTIETYDSHLTEYVTYLHQQGTSVVSATWDTVESFVEACVGRGNRRSTISGKLSTVAELYRYAKLDAEENVELALDPIQFRSIDLSEYNVPAPIEREALSRREVRLLFDEFTSYRDRLMAVVGVETGLRNSDIRGLRLQDVNEETLYVHEPKNSTPYTVPISDQLRDELQIWIDRHRPGYPSAEVSDYVFLSQNGGPLRTNASLNQMVKTAAKRAGVQETIGKSELSDARKEQLGTDQDSIEWKRVTAHTLRHTCISLMQEDGVSLPYRQLVANHANPETTLGYSHGENDVHTTVRGQYNVPR